MSSDTKKAGWAVGMLVCMGVAAVAFQAGPVGWIIGGVAVFALMYCGGCMLGEK